MRARTVDELVNNLSADVRNGRLEQDEILNRLTWHYMPIASTWGCVEALKRLVIECMQKRQDTNALDVATDAMIERLNLSDMIKELPRHEILFLVSESLRMDFERDIRMVFLIEQFSFQGKNTRELQERKALKGMINNDNTPRSPGVIMYEDKAR